MRSEWVRCLCYECAQDQEKEEERERETEGDTTAERKNGANDRTNGR